MSTATASPNISHLPHTAHPIPLREHAFTLHCQGLRSPAIAAELGVSERTIRAWIAAALADLKDDLQLNRREQLLLAVARQHQLTAVAWQQFEAEAAARNAILDAARDTLVNAANNPVESVNPSTRPLHVHLPASTPAPRYLSLILQATKETNRLLGLHTLARLHLLTPDVPETDPAPLTDADIPAESATDSHSPLLAGERLPPQRSLLLSEGGTGQGVRSHFPAKTAPDTAAESATAITDMDMPAESATHSQSAEADFVAARPPGTVSTAGSPPAESATASGSPLPVGAARAEGSDVTGAERAESAAVGLGVRSQSPAFRPASSPAQAGYNA